MSNPLIYGKAGIDNVVGMHVDKNKMKLYIADGDGIKIHSRPFENYILMSKYDADIQPGRLDGNNHYRYYKKAPPAEIYQLEQICKRKGIDTWRCYDRPQSAMLKEGYGCYQGMTIDQVSTLSFDIETTGVTINENSYVLLISNTFRSRSGNITKRLFDFTDYNTPKDFIDAWCKWVRQCDPDILLGHNVFGFDLPYLDTFAKLHKTALVLGRDESAIKFARNPKQFRKDGSQAYDYYNATVVGRNIIDTFFLSIKFDTGRKYPNYRLKDIIAYEGLEKEDRQHWDFSVNKEPWNNPSDWTKFCQYAKDDADDALALYDLMAPQFFYYAQSMPMQFQDIINRATGSQVNMFMIRSYLQYGKSIPKGDQKEPYEGAISIGNPGLYQNVFKIDVASLYPSIILEHEVYDINKDPHRNFIAMVKYFTEARLENKRLAKETGERYYKDISDGQKIMINSAYGFMGAPGLNFNYPKGASFVTEKGRDILKSAIKWASGQDVVFNKEDKWHLVDTPDKGRGFPIVNADTDSISYVCNDNSYIHEHLEEINRIYTKKIVWEDDGVFESFLVIKAKNYAMLQDGKIKIKGSALKATMKETALKEFLQKTLNLLMENKRSTVPHLYQEYVEKVCNLDDISEWASKKTITKKVLFPERTQERRILEAVKGKDVQEGDKIRVFFETDKSLKCVEDFSGVYHRPTLHGKLFNTVKVLAPVLDMGDFPNYKLKGKQKELIKLGLIEEVL